MLDDLTSMLERTGVFKVLGVAPVDGGVCIRGQVSRGGGETAGQVWGSIIRNLLVGARKDGIAGVDISRAYDIRTVIYNSPAGARRLERLVCAWRLILPERAIPYLRRECLRVAETRRRAQDMSRGEIPLGSTAVEGAITAPSRSQAR